MFCCCLSRKNDQADDVVMRLKNRLSREAKHGRDLEDAFISIDRNGDGHIDVFEFENAMKKLGGHTSSPHPHPPL